MLVPRPSYFCWEVQCANLVAAAPVILVSTAFQTVLFTSSPGYALNRYICAMETWIMGVTRCSRGQLESCTHSSRSWAVWCGETALKQHYVLFDTGGRNVEESAPHWRHVSHLSWLNAPSYNRFVYVTCVPGGTLASLALRGRQQQQDKTRRVKLLFWTCIVMI